MRLAFRQELQHPTKLWSMQIQVSVLPFLWSLQTSVKMNFFGRG